MYYLIPKIYEEVLSQIQTVWLNQNQDAYIVLTGIYEQEEVAEAGTDIETTCKAQDKSYIKSVSYSIDIEQEDKIYKHTLTHFLLEAHEKDVNLMQVVFPADVQNFTTAEELRKFLKN